VFAGAKKRENDEWSETTIRKNLTYQDRVVTLRMTPGMSNDAFTFNDVFEGRAQTADVPNGGACSGGANCTSNFCRNGVCVACGPQLACPAGFSCVYGGYCVKPSSSDAPRASSPSKPATGGKRGKGLGQMCKSSAECESGRMCRAQSRTRSTCQ